MNDKHYKYYALVQERDHPDVLQSRGAIVQECYMHSASLDDIKERAEYMGDRYGKCRIFQLIEVDDNGAPL